MVPIFLQQIGENLKKKKVAATSAHENATEGLVRILRSPFRVQQYGAVESDAATCFLLDMAMATANLLANFLQCQLQSSKNW